MWILQSVTVETKYGIIIENYNFRFQVTFASVGGLKDHVKCLQEMVVFPLLYPEFFTKFHLTPPRGVLFCGPPGTGDL